VNPLASNLLINPDSPSVESHEIFKRLVRKKSEKLFQTSRPGSGTCSRKSILAEGWINYCEPKRPWKNCWAAVEGGYIWLFEKPEDNFEPPGLNSPILTISLTSCDIESEKPLSDSISISSSQDNESINESISESVTESVTESVNESVAESVNEPEEDSYLRQQILKIEKLEKGEKVEDSEEEEEKKKKGKVQEKESEDEEEDDDDDEEEEEEEDEENDTDSKQASSEAESKQDDADTKREEESEEEVIEIKTLGYGSYKKRRNILIVKNLKGALILKLSFKTKEMMLSWLTSMESYSHY